MEKEKVIFRREYNPYRKEWSFLAVFPDETDWRGLISCVPFYFIDEWDGTQTTIFECSCDMDRPYYYNKTRIIHKKDAVVDKLLSAIEKRYNQQFRVVEKIMY